MGSQGLEGSERGWDLQGLKLKGICTSENQRQDLALFIERKNRVLITYKSVIFYACKGPLVAASNTTIAHVTRSNVTATPRSIVKLLTS